MRQIQTNDTVRHLRVYNQLMALREIGRKRRKLKQREERGTLHPAPMDPQVRISNYQNQNGTRHLTPKQLRRITRKGRKAAGHV